MATGQTEAKSKDDHPMAQLVTYLLEFNAASPFRSTPPPTALPTCTDGSYPHSIFSAPKIIWTSTYRNLLSPHTTPNSLLPLFCTSFQFTPVDANFPLLCQQTHQQPSTRLLAPPCSSSQQCLSCPTHILHPSLSLA